MGRHFSSSFSMCLLVMLAFVAVRADDHQLQGTRKKRPPAQLGRTASQPPLDQRPTDATPPPVNAKQEEEEEEEDPEMMRKVQEFRKRKKAALEAPKPPPPPPPHAPQPTDPAPSPQPPAGASYVTAVPTGGESGSDEALESHRGAGTQDSTDGENVPGAGPGAGAGRAVGGDGDVPNVETDEDGEAERRRVAEAGEEASVIAEKLRERGEQVLALPQPG